MLSKLYRRTTVDLPLMMHAQMREAALDRCNADKAAWNGMFRRWLEEAVKEKLERTLNPRGAPYWPLMKENLPPQRFSTRPPRAPVAEYQPLQEELDAEERRRRLELGNVVRPRPFGQNTPATMLAPVPARPMPDAFDPTAELDEPPAIEDPGKHESEQGFEDLL